MKESEGLVLYRMIVFPMMIVFLLGILIPFVMVYSLIKHILQGIHEGAKCITNIIREKYEEVI